MEDAVSQERVRELRERVDEVDRELIRALNERARLVQEIMALKVEAWAQRYLSDLMEKVTDAEFVMVALDREGRPKPVPPEGSGRRG